MSLLVEVCKWWLREGHSSILIPVYHCVALHKDLLSWQLEFKENQQKEITVKCCSISASSLCYLVKPGSESCADQRFQIGFILPCYHSPCSTEQWVRKQLSPPPVTHEIAGVLILPLLQSTQAYASIGKLISFLSLHDFLLYSLLIGSGSKSRERKSI